jgi:hypothetical protein
MTLVSCGTETHFAVTEILSKASTLFYEQNLFRDDQALTMAVFRSVEPPFDINSAGLCETFTYEIGAAIDKAAVPAKPVDVGVESGN